MKRVWDLPYGCRIAILHIICNAVPLYDVICKRSIMFIRRCLQSESVLVKAIANHGRMTSTLGRNVQKCSERLSIRMLNGYRLTGYRF